jgi:sugar-specific transcriptional regulator TrmB
VRKLSENKEQGWIADRQAEFQEDLARRERLWKEITDEPAPDSVRHVWIENYMSSVLNEHRQMFTDIRY